MDKTDVLIIGAGPAACSAALTLKNRNLHATLAYGTDGALALAHEVTNYPGLMGKSGKEMLDIFRAEARQSGASIVNRRVSTLLKMGKGFSAQLGEDILNARAVIFTTGVTRSATLKNEEALIGRGVSYCATCDAMFYRNQHVVVIGMGENAVEEANFLATLMQVTYIRQKPHNIDNLNRDIDVVDSQPLEILGDAMAQGVRTKDTDVVAQGVFILRDAVAPSLLLPALKTEKNALWHDGAMRTNLPRVYVAGDAAGAPYQIAKAVGEGNIAALSAAEDLQDG